MVCHPIAKRKCATDISLAHSDPHFNSDPFRSPSVALANRHGHAFSASRFAAANPNAHFNPKAIRRTPDCLAISICFSLSESTDAFALPHAQPHPSAAWNRPKRGRNPLS